MTRYVKIRGQGGATHSVKVGDNGLSEGALQQMISAGEAQLAGDEKSAAEPEGTSEPEPKPGRPRKTTAKETDSGEE